MRIRSGALPVISALVAATGCENVAAPTEPVAASHLRFAFGVFDWDVPPVAFTEFYDRPCEHCGSIQGIRSGYRSGSYGVDPDGDGVRDGTLTVDVELISEVIPAGDGNYEYTWTLSNKGTGAIVGFAGSGGPGFSFTTDSPLLGTAGADRVVGTADDLPAAQVANSSRIGGFRRTYAWGITVNPSAGFVTGGGWIQSPAGAGRADHALAGRADFGFVSAYQKSAATPSGQTVFHFAWLVFASRVSPMIGCSWPAHAHSTRAREPSMAAVTTAFS